MYKQCLYCLLCHMLTEHSLRPILSNDVQYATKCECGFEGILITSPLPRGSFGNKYDSILPYEKLPDYTEDEILNVLNTGLPNAQGVLK